MASRRADPRRLQGTPTAYFPNTDCDIASHFDANNIIINLTFCACGRASSSNISDRCLLAGGDWAGQDSIFQGAGCPGTCVGACSHPFSPVSVLTPRTQTTSTTTPARSPTRSGTLRRCACTSKHKKSARDIRASVKSTRFRLFIRTPLAVTTSVPASAVLSWSHCTFASVLYSKYPVPNDRVPRDPSHVYLMRKTQVTVFSTRILGEVRVP